MLNNDKEKKFQPHWDVKLMTPNGVGTPYNLFINSQLSVQLNFPKYVPHAMKGQKLLARTKALCESSITYSQLS